MSQPKGGLPRSSYRRSTSLVVGRKHSRSSSLSVKEGSGRGKETPLHGPLKAKASEISINSKSITRSRVYFNNAEDTPPELGKLGDCEGVRFTYQTPGQIDAPSGKPRPASMAQPKFKRKSRWHSISQPPLSPVQGPEGPVPFKKLEKPVDWQGEQAVEIRRDWIAYLAKGMGLDTTDYAGAALENLVVHKMIQRAANDHLWSSSDDMDTDEAEAAEAAEFTQTPRNSRPSQRSEIGKRRSSKSHDQSRVSTNRRLEELGSRIGRRRQGGKGGGKGGGRCGGKGGNQLVENGTRNGGSGETVQAIWGDWSGRKYRRSQTTGVLEEELSTGPLGRCRDSGGEGKCPGRRRNRPASVSVPQGKMMRASPLDSVRSAFPEFEGTPCTSTTAEAVSASAGVPDSTVLRATIATNPLNDTLSAPTKGPDMPMVTSSVVNTSVGESGKGSVIAMPRVVALSVNTAPSVSGGMPRFIQGMAEVVGAGAWVGEEPSGSLTHHHKSEDSAERRSPSRTPTLNTCREEVIAKCLCKGVRGETVGNDAAGEEGGWGGEPSWRNAKKMETTPLGDTANEVLSPEYQYVQLRNKSRDQNKELPSLPEMRPQQQLYNLDNLRPCNQRESDMPQPRGHRGEGGGAVGANGRVVQVPASQRGCDKWSINKSGKVGVGGTHSKDSKIPGGGTSKDGDGANKTHPNVGVKEESSAKHAQEIAARPMSASSVGVKTVAELTLTEGRINRQRVSQAKLEERVSMLQSQGAHHTNGQDRAVDGAGLAVTLGVGKKSPVRRSNSGLIPPDMMEEERREMRQELITSKQWMIGIEEYELADRMDSDCSQESRADADCKIVDTASNGGRSLRKEPQHRPPTHGRGYSMPNIASPSSPPIVLGGAGPSPFAAAWPSSSTSSRSPEESTASKSLTKGATAPLGVEQMAERSMSDTRWGLTLSTPNCNSNGTSNVSKKGGELRVGGRDGKEVRILEEQPQRLVAPPAYTAAPVPQPARSFPAPRAPAVPSRRPLEPNYSGDSISPVSSEGSLFSLRMTNGQGGNLAIPAAVAAAGFGQSGTPDELLGVDSEPRAAPTHGALASVPKGRDAANGNTKAKPLLTGRGKVGEGREVEAAAMVVAAPNASQGGSVGRRGRDRKPVPIGAAAGGMGLIMGGGLMESSIATHAHSRSTTPSPGGRSQMGATSVPASQRLVGELTGLPPTGLSGSGGGGGRSEGNQGEEGKRNGKGLRYLHHVQKITAAAAAAAAVDGGGYGPEWDKLEMHRAVYANIGPRLEHFVDCRPRGLGQLDHHNNTPLLLAIKLGRTDLALMMVRAGAELDMPSDEAFHLLDETIVMGDEHLLVEVYSRLQRKAWGRWREKVPRLLSLMEDSIPDFYMEMHWKFECSNVLAPIVRAVAPHDQYRIWKKGSWLRMDSTITGYSKRLKTQRGQVSLIFLGNDSPSPGALIKLDHEKRKIYNVLRRLESPTPSEIRRTCRRYLKAGDNKRPVHQVDAFVFKSSDLVFSPCLDSLGILQKGQVGRWPCERHMCTGDVALQTFRKGSGDNLLSGLPMKDYFDASRTLEEKVLQATRDDVMNSPGLFGLGDRSKEQQKAKSLAKLRNPYKKYEKRIKADMWMSKDFPLSLEHVKPMLEVLSMQDKVVQKLKEVLGTKGMREAGFPAKVSLPLYLGVFAVVTFDNCKVYRPGELDPELFLVNPDYGSSKRMRKGVYEGVMPGRVVIPPRKSVSEEVPNRATREATVAPPRIGGAAGGGLRSNVPGKTFEPPQGPQGSEQGTPVKMRSWRRLGSFGNDRERVGNKVSSNGGSAVAPATATPVRTHMRTPSRLVKRREAGNCDTTGGDSDESDEDADMLLQH